MRCSEASIRYARALFELAQGKNVVAEMDRELEALGAIIKKNPSILHLVLNSAISNEEKEGFLSRVLGQTVSPLLMNFLKVLLKKNRFKELESIQLEFHSFHEKKQGIQEVKVISAVPLNSENKNRLQTMLEKQWNTKIRMSSVLDPKILGGLILRFNNQQIDGSYRNRLEMLRQQLLS